MKNRNERIFDVLILAAAEDALHEELNEIPSCEELDKIYKPSPEMDIKMRRLIASAENTRKTKNILALAGKTVASFLIMFVITAIILFSVEASRVYILNMFMKMNDNHISIEFHPNDDSSEISKYYTKYIPDGFDIENIFSDENSRTFVYSNKVNKMIVLSIFFAETSSVFVDHERNISFPVRINNNEAYFFESNFEDEKNVLIWQDDNIAFNLSANLDKEQMIMIAENVLK